jgi:hypothetical protein
MMNRNTWFITSGLASRGSHLLAVGLSSEAAISLLFAFAFQKDFRFGRVPRFENGFFFLLYIGFGWA